MSHQAGVSSTFRAAVNLAKVCIGAGVLALPYATSRGGLLFSPLVIGLVAAWNAIACRLMIECKRATVGMPVPDGISSTYSVIAYHGAGYWGVYLTDFSIVITLLGVCVAYQITFATLMSEVPQIAIASKSLIIVSSFVLAPVSFVKDISILSFFSLAGLICLIIGVASIICYGVYKFGGETLSHPLSPSTDPGTSLSFWPDDMIDMTMFIGVASFCFGLCSMAFPIEESMRIKEDFGKAVLYSLIFVWVVYTLIGELGAILYIHDVEGIKDNILRNLPESEFASSIVRISMALVCLLTYPLTFIAPAQIIESYIRRINIRQCVNAILCQPQYQTVRDSDNTDEHTTESISVFQIVNRMTLMFLIAFLAVSIPCFGMIISLLGGFTVAITSFVLPPVLHLYIISHPTKRIVGSLRQVALQKLPFNASSEYSSVEYYKDIVYIVCGILLTLIATSVTLVGFVNQMRNGQGCNAT